MFFPGIQYMFFGPRIVTAQADLKNPSTLRTLSEGSDLFILAVPGQVKKGANNFAEPKKASSAGAVLLGMFKNYDLTCIYQQAPKRYLEKEESSVNEQAGKALAVWLGPVPKITGRKDDNAPSIVLAQTLVTTEKHPSIEMLRKSYEPVVNFIAAQRARAPHKSIKVAIPALGAGNNGQHVDRSVEAFYEALAANPLRMDTQVEYLFVEKDLKKIPILNDAIENHRYLLEQVTSQGESKESAAAGAECLDLTQKCGVAISDFLKKKVRSNKDKLIAARSLFIQGQHAYHAFEKGPAQIVSPSGEEKSDAPKPTAPTTPLASGLYPGSVSRCQIEQSHGAEKPTAPKRTDLTRPLLYRSPQPYSYHAEPVGRPKKPTHTPPTPSRTGSNEVECCCFYRSGIYHRTVFCPTRGMGGGVSEGYGQAASSDCGSCCEWGDGRPVA